MNANGPDLVWFFWFFVIGMLVIGVGALISWSFEKVWKWLSPEGRTRCIVFLHLGALVFFLSYEMYVGVAAVLIIAAYLLGFHMGKEEGRLEGKYGKEACKQAREIAHVLDMDSREILTSGRMEEYQKAADARMAECAKALGPTPLERKIAKEGKD